MADQKSRIAALLKKGADAGASEAEAIEAIKLADRLMEKHGLSLEDIQGDDGERVELFEGVELKGRLAMAHKYFTQPLADFCHVSCHQKRSLFSNWKMQWVGYPSDVDLAKFLYTVIGRAIMIESRRYRPYNLRKASKLRDDFAAAMALRIGERLHALTSERPSVDTFPPGSIVLVRNAEIADFEASLEIGKGRKPRIRTVDPYASDAGRNAGDAVSLGRPVTGDQAALMIEGDA